MRFVLLAVVCLAGTSSLSAGPAENTPASSNPAPRPSPVQPQPGETAWLCRSKFYGIVYWGRLSHSSVAICPAGEYPAVPGPNGMVNNPRCAFYGTQPRHCGFLPETLRLDVTCRPARLPVEAVKQRIRDEQRPWRIWRTCHVAAEQATGWSEPRPGLLKRCLGLWRALLFWRCPASCPASCPTACPASCTAACPAH